MARRPEKPKRRRPQTGATSTRPAALPAETQAEQVTAHVELKVAGSPVEVDLTVPTRPVPPGAILPAFQILTNAIVGNAERAVAAEGRTISCRAGCGACCRQLVPISEIEARFLRDLVAALPEPRRSVILDRVAGALRRLDEAGLLETLRHPELVADEDRSTLGMAYFRLGIPCIFLDDESCSIHPVRPLVCREYLVTSPASECVEPTIERVHRVEVPVKLSGTLARFADESAPVTTTWVPLVLALEWAESHPDQSPPRPGPEWVRQLFRNWSGRDLPPDE
jgi:Fe-S-cluster containining protein